MVICTATAYALHCVQAEAPLDTNALAGVVHTIELLETYEIDAHACE